MSKVIILGSGAASGVPTISDGWCKCNPQNPKNRRSRAGVYVELGAQKFLVDTSADIRNQLIDNNIRKVDAVFYTHVHADHVMGIDDLRALSFRLNEIDGMNHPKRGRILDIYATSEHIDEIRHRFSYVMVDENNTDGTHRPQLMPHKIEYLKDVKIGDAVITPLEFAGHTVTTTGYVFNGGQLVIIPDYKVIPPQTLEYLQKINVNVLIMPLTEVTECLYHAGIDIDLRYIDIIKPKRVIFTHLGPECDFDMVRSICPKNTEPAFDNMEIEL